MQKVFRTAIVAFAFFAASQALVAQTVFDNKLEPVVFPTKEPMAAYELTDYVKVRHWEYLFQTKEYFAGSIENLFLSFHLNENENTPSLAHLRETALWLKTLGFDFSMLDALDPVSRSELQFYFLLPEIEKSAGVFFLLDSGLDINEKHGQLHRTLLAYYCDQSTFPDRLTVLGYLIAQGAEYDRADKVGFHVAIYRDGMYGGHNEEVIIPRSAVEKYAGIIRKQAVIRAVYCHNYLTDDKDFYKYHPLRAFDGNPATAWLDGEDGPGIGHGIGVSLDRKITADTITISAGYSDARWFEDNNRVKNITVSLNGKTFTFPLLDGMKAQILPLGGPITFNNAFFIVNDVYRAAGSNDTAISEIVFSIKTQPIRLDTNKLSWYLRPLARTEAVREMQDEVAQLLPVQDPKAPVQAPVMKLTPKHFATLRDVLGINRDSVTWRDANGNGLAELTEMEAVDVPRLAAFWKAANLVETGGGISMDDYCALILQKLADSKAQDVEKLLANTIDLGFTGKYYPSASLSRYYRGFGSSYLTVAAALGNLAWLERFSKLGCDVNAQTKDQAPPLFFAIQEMKTGAVQWLLDHGADINLRSASVGLSPVGCAIGSGNIDLVQYLVKRGADIKSRTDDGYTLLHIAVINRNLALLEYFQKLGLSPEDKAKDGRNAAALSLNNDANENMLIQLIANKIDCSYIWPNSDNLLDKAVSLGWAKAGEALIKTAGLSPNGRGGILAPIWKAISSDKKNVITMLLRNGADPNVVDISGQSLLFQAVEKDDVTLVQLLLSYRADVTLKDKEGRTALDRVRSIYDRGWGSQTKQKYIIDLLEKAAASQSETEN